MKKISVDELQDGMVLARDICATSGNILVGKGTTLSAAMGRRLKNWGVTHVQIEGEEDQIDVQSASTVSPEEIKEKLQQKFSRVLENSIMQEIFTAVYKFKVNQNKG